VLAPTGTIGLMMDCDTTGIEPDLGLVKVKKLVGGGTMHIVNQTVPRALKALGYTKSRSTTSSPTSTPKRPSRRTAPQKEHAGLRLLDGRQLHPLPRPRQDDGAVQPFISGAISKTVNMPEEAPSKMSSSCTSTPGRWA
jgi:ribonucleoside-diphosphate reductase alpha chain